MRNKSNWKYQVPREIVPLDSILYTRLYVFSFDQAGTGRGKERIERERVVGEAAVCVIIRRESEVRGPVGGNNRNALAGIPIFRLRLREMGQLINYAAQLFPVSRGVRKERGREREAQTFLSSHNPIRNHSVDRENNCVTHDYACRCSCNSPPVLGKSSIRMYIDDDNVDQRAYSWFSFVRKEYVQASRITVFHSSRYEIKKILDQCNFEDSSSFKSFLVHSSR